MDTVDLMRLAKKLAADDRQEALDALEVVMSELELLLSKEDYDYFNFTVGYIYEGCQRVKPFVIRPMESVAVH